MRGVERAELGSLVWRAFAFLLLVCAAALVLLTAAFAAENASTKIGVLPALPAAARLPATATAKPTPARVEFCQRHPAECSIDLSEPATIKLNRETWSTIRAVNRRVNASITPISDQDHWGVPDRWDLAEDGYGDCEDIQLVKRKLLAERGLPRRAMRMTVVIDYQGDGHAVLMLRTDRGDFILDNKTDAVLPWDKTRYLFSKREGQASSAWVSLGGVAPPVMTAQEIARYRSSTAALVTLAAPQRMLPSWPRSLIQSELQQERKDDPDARNNPLAYARKQHRGSE
jgi:predicted transglutaminase-like cysteine proteinase